MANFNWYSQAFVKALGGSINFSSDTIKIALLSSSYTPSLAHDFKDDLSGEVSGTGYTAGGATLGSKTLTSTVANSFGTTWAASTAYQTGDIVRPTTGNGKLYRAEAAGTSGASEPTWTTLIGDEITDSGVVWTCVGSAIVQLDAADPSWTTATFSGVRYAVIYDATPGSDATRPLIGYIDFGADQAVVSGTFTIQFSALGFLYVVVA